MAHFTLIIWTIIVQDPYIYWRVLTNVDNNHWGPEAKLVKRVIEPAFHHHFVSVAIFQCRIRQESKVPIVSKIHISLEGTILIEVDNSRWGPEAKLVNRASKLVFDNQFASLRIFQCRISQESKVQLGSPRAFQIFSVENLDSRIKPYKTKWWCPQFFIYMVNLRDIAEVITMLN